MYFASFPQIIYDAKGTGNFEIATHMLKRVALRTKVRTNTLLYDTYDVRDGESPESIAFKLYGSTEYHWVILYVNNIVDRYHDWPMSGQQFLEFVDEKYDNPNGIHHYEIAQSSGDTTVKINIGTDNTDYPSATAITNFEFEENRQDEIRQIRLLDPGFVEQFVTEFRSVMKESVL
tara:strand:- start:64 stop:591 length:528 start_codon:yes stop_codon:yes gene_type:complete